MTGLIPVVRTTFTQNAFRQITFGQSAIRPPAAFRSNCANPHESATDAPAWPCAPLAGRAAQSLPECAGGKAARDPRHPQPEKFASAVRAAAQQSNRSTKERSG